MSDARGGFTQPTQVERDPIGRPRIYGISFIATVAVILIVGLILADTGEQSDSGDDDLDGLLAPVLLVVGVALWLLGVIVAELVAFVVRVSRVRR